jgi:hypothetical protein
MTTADAIRAGRSTPPGSTTDVRTRSMTRLARDHTRNPKNADATPATIVRNAAGPGATPP